jgi:hypothetical protein
MQSKQGILLFHNWNDCKKIHLKKQKNWSLSQKLDIFIWNVVWYKGNLQCNKNMRSNHIYLLWVVAESRVPGPSFVCGARKWHQPWWNIRQPWSRSKSTDTKSAVFESLMNLSLKCFHFWINFQVFVKTSVKYKKNHLPSRGASLMFKLDFDRIGNPKSCYCVG